MTGLFADDRTLRSRFEIKYLVRDDQVAAIRRFIQPFVRHDPHARNWPGHRYPICSLYFDDRDFRLCRTTLEGIKNRFKLRVRSYSDDSLQPAYCEIKRRIDRIIVKRRARIDREHVRTLVEGRLPRIEGLDARSRDSLTEFHALVLALQARPVIRIRYLREAYEGALGEPVRLTFDTGVQWHLTSDPDVTALGEGWSNAPIDRPILEVKFTELYPAWLGRMAEMFQLRQLSVAKYVLSIRATGKLQEVGIALPVPRCPVGDRFNAPIRPDSQETA